MGAFLLVSDRATGFNIHEATETIKRQCLTTPVKFNFPGWEMYLFPKGVRCPSNYIESGNFSVYATGTPYLSGHGYSSTLNRKLLQFSKGNIDPDDVRGLYFMLFNDGQRLRFATDRNSLYSIYHTSDGNIISSSFLGICGGVGKISPHREAMIENLLTGSLIGSDTVFAEIKRFESSVPFSFTGLEIIQHTKRQTDLMIYKTREESLTAQAEILDSLFKGMIPLAEECGIDSGITGGLDSRLLLALCRKHFPSTKLQFHSHLRKTPDKDFLCGKEICSKMALQFIETPVRDIYDLSGNEVINKMNEGMLFNDGQVRTHSFWHEEFNSSTYRVRTLRDKRLGLNGIGGEQYRNLERIMFPSRDLRQWIRFELIEKQSGHRVSGDKTRMELTDRIAKKTELKLDCNGNRKVNLLLLKRYMNEIYNPANRALRSSHENRLSFFLSPFTDPYIAQSAYSLVDHLGVSVSYEAELINRIDPEVASLNSAYGFRFNRREPVYSVVPGVLFSNFLPASIQSSVYERMSSRASGRWDLMLKKHAYLGRCAEALASFSLPVIVKEMIRRTDLGPLVFAMGHLLVTYNEKITR
jgi:hypothetical protein